MEWYALFVKTGEEERVHFYLDKLLPDANRKILIPKRRLIERRQGKAVECTKTLLPGYVLFRTEMDVHYYYELKKVPGLLRILKGEQEFPCIKESVIAVILALTGGEDVIGFSELYKKGDEIHVVSGPLKDLEGIIEAFDYRKKRVKVCFELGGQTKRVDLGAEWVQKDVGTPPAPKKS